MATPITVSSNTTLTEDDQLVLVDASGGAVTVTLSEAWVDTKIRVVKVDSSLNAVTIHAPSGTISGSTNKTLSVQWNTIHIESDGTNYFVID